MRLRSEGGPFSIETGDFVVDNSQGDARAGGVGSEGVDTHVADGRIELAEVAGPAGVGRSGEGEIALFRVWVKDHGGVLFFVPIIKSELSVGRQVAEAFAEGGQGDGMKSDAGEEVFAEGVLGDELAEVAIRGADEAEVGGDRCGKITQAIKRFFVERVQEHCLRFW